LFLIKGSQSKYNPPPSQNAGEAEPENPDGESPRQNKARSAAPQPGPSTQPGHRAPQRVGEPDAVDGQPAKKRQHVSKAYRCTVDPVLSTNKASFE
jgi:hypothetical protein